MSQNATKTCYLRTSSWSHFMSAAQRWGLAPSLRTWCERLRSLGQRWANTTPTSRPPELNENPSLRIREKLENFQSVKTNWRIQRMNNWYLLKIKTTEFDPPKVSCWKIVLPPQKLKEVSQQILWLDEIWVDGYSSYQLRGKNSSSDATSCSACRGYCPGHNKELIRKHFKRHFLMVKFTPAFARIVSQSCQ